MTAKNKKLYLTLGASNHTNKIREANDYYATEPKATELLLENEKFSQTIWECACGAGHIGKVFEQHKYNVFATDIVYRGYGQEEPLDFLSSSYVNTMDIITNPPYKYAQQFVEKALNSVRYGGKVAMLLRIQFLEGKKKKKFIAKISS